MLLKVSLQCYSSPSDTQFRSEAQRRASRTDLSLSEESLEEYRHLCVAFFVRSSSFLLMSPQESASEHPRS